MINYSLPTATIVHKYFSKHKLAGHEKVTLLCASLVQGKHGVELPKPELRNKWRTGIFKTSYSSTYMARAHERGWIVEDNGLVHVTAEGLDHINSLVPTQVITPTANQSLLLFSAGQTHSFDKHLRQLISGAKSTIRIIDSYVDETIFDNLLDQASASVQFRLIYGKASGSFDTRVKRFGKQYPKFSFKKNPSLHDRMIIIDSIGYLLGPSLKDAADRSPANMVRLNHADSERLIQFFNSQWKLSK